MTESPLAEALPRMQQRQRLGQVRLRWATGDGGGCQRSAWSWLLAAGCWLLRDGDPDIDIDAPSQVCVCVCVCECEVWTYI
ncbi:hypothetical protein BCR44DRAFT_1447987 [Catenaria anguillulae PL171]|uniref:Uncharacterized protein n=1 Tax=Catenaria anguillulae PL171 TaxID=765915 RepID=A0A1Y2H5A3_9FUNG|nr:hypothetical protein BCR44DRAFT_1447987 [Catenaria anguillulae PL171]